MNILYAVKEVHFSFHNMGMFIVNNRLSYLIHNPFWWLRGNAGVNISTNVGVYTYIYIWG